MSSLGHSLPRHDALDKVTGRALYPGDLNFPNQAHMKILFARRPHALIRRLDTSRAETLPGVLAVFTAKDVPNNEYGLITPDQPVLCGPGSNKPHADRVRFIGDQVALVVAETERIAEKALALIEVEYEDLPIVADVLKAMQPGACLLHPDVETYPAIRAVPHTNIMHHYQIRKGEVEQAFAQSAVVIESEYHTPVQEHAYLQPEAGVGYIDEEGRVTVQVAGQWTHEDQEQIAHALGLPREQVRVIYPAIGGAFGGREDMSVQIVLALAAWRLHQRGINRPVKIIWSREESMIGHHKRHAYIFRSKWGAAQDGKLLAAQVEIIEDGGAYAYTSTKVLGNATLMCTGPYEIPNVKVDAYAVYTNNIPGGAFRGFGGPQAAFAAEQQMNKLAEALGLDPVEIRRRNTVREGALLSVNSPLPAGVSMPQVIEACAAEFERLKVDKLKVESSRFNPQPSTIKRGLGFACGFKNVGFSFGAPEECWATVEVRGGAEIEEVILYHAAAEVGQGAHVALRQMTAEAAGVPIEKVQLVMSDTATSKNSGSVSASRMTFMAGNAIRGAVEIALQKWQDEDRPAIGTYQYKPPRTTIYDPETGACDPNFAYGYVAEAALVEVDTETGQIHILDLVCVDDVGKAINRQQIEGQIEGGVVQAAGYALLENFIQKEGRALNPYLSTYLIPGVLDIPARVHSVILEFPAPIGPWGARGMAEMPYIPLAPAVTAAVHDALGVWFDDFPLTPERVLRGMGRI
ncbi:MAG: xanthine dehydrogenase subunit D [Anaerolineales bacterium]